MDEVQTVVVGAGVIGIAIARNLARQGHDVLILEAEERIAQHTSSRNSQVIHAGIYYEPGSWRAKLCIAGKIMLYDYCKDRHVPFENTQKLIVAAEENHLTKIPVLIANAEANGVNDLIQITATEAVSLEPALACRGAILSPSTGIVDVPAFILSLLGEAKAEGVFVALGSPLERVVLQNKGFELYVGDSDCTRLNCKNLVNAAGLGAWNVARSIEGFPSMDIPEQHFAKGSWFSMTGSAPFERLIYPVPDDESLGVHYTRDMGGGFRFGPDLKYLNPPHVDYSLGVDQSIAFEKSVQRWWPDLPISMMQPDGCGIRPRVLRDPNKQSDFVFLSPQDHGIEGLVQMFGVESPGLTSALAIANLVTELLEQPVN